MGKSRLGQAVAVPGGLQRAAAAEEVEQRQLQLHVRGRHADQHHGSGQVAGVERLLLGLRPADRVDHHVGAVAAGELLDRLDRVGRSRELTVWVAPKSRAHSSFLSSMSTAMIVRAPASAAPAIAASPTPPQPITATVSSAGDARRC